MSNQQQDSDFATALDDALAAVREMHDGASRLSASVDTGKPDAIQRDVIAFEGKIETAKPALDRLYEVLRDSKHHTLESAYHALMATPGSEQEAARMREMIIEYRQMRGIIAAAGRRIDTTLASIEEAAWGDSPPASSGARVDSLA